MRICYDETKYVKGKRIYRLSDLIVGKQYLFESDLSLWVAHISQIGVMGYLYVYYQIVNAPQYKLNGFEMCLHGYMVENKYPVFTIYEAVKPTFTCKRCGSHDTPAPIHATHVLNGQRIGYSCNYWRCSCGTINRHIWNSGYPTRYELQKGVA